MLRNQDTCRDITQRCDDFFASKALSVYALCLPFRSSTELAEENQRGIHEKILKNRSNLVTDFNRAACITADGAVPQEDMDALRGIDELTHWLVDGNDATFTKNVKHWFSEPCKGVVVIVAEPVEPTPNAEVVNGAGIDDLAKWRPVGGGVVTWRRGETERRVDALWCRRNLHRGLHDSNFLRYLTVRVVAEAFALSEDAEEKEQGLVSVLDVFLKHFPREAVSFLTAKDDESLGMNQHFESPANPGTHQTRGKCRCWVTEKVPDSWKFWGTNASCFKDFCKKSFFKSGRRTSIPYFAATNSRRDKRVRK
eukprot:Lankesteria_metandrocarpae@DN2326_c0_g1_i1.p1